jgi:hypothetical protein
MGLFEPSKLQNHSPSFCFEYYHLTMGGFGLMTHFAQGESPILFSLLV